MTQPAPPTQEVEPSQHGYGTVATITALETGLAPVVLAAYTTWLAAVLKVLFPGGDTETARPVNPTNIWATVPLWNREVDRVILPTLHAPLLLGWGDALEELGLDRRRFEFHDGDPLVRAALEEVRNLLVRLPEESYRHVVRELDEAVNNGEDLRKQSARVRNVFDVRGSENWPARATTVAVTEVNRAVSLGAMAAAQRAQQLIGRVVKTWDAKRDAQVRPAHKQVDDTSQLLNEPFIVDGFPMSQPLDPSAPAYLVVNCRCRVRVRRL